MFNQMNLIKKIEVYISKNYTASNEEDKPKPFYNLMEPELRRSQKAYVKWLKTKPLVKIVPDPSTEVDNVKTLILKKHFKKWEKANRLKINNLIDNM